MNQHALTRIATHLFAAILVAGFTLAFTSHKNYTDSFIKFEPGGTINAKSVKTALPYAQDATNFLPSTTTQFYDIKPLGRNITTPPRIFLMHESDDAGDLVSFTITCDPFNDDSRQVSVDLPLAGNRSAIWFKAAGNSAYLLDLDADARYDEFHLATPAGVLKYIFIDDGLLKVDSIKDSDARAGSVNYEFANGKWRPSTD